MNLSKLKALYKKATPGEWMFEDTPHNQFVRYKGGLICALAGISARTADFKLIAALHNAFPMLAIRLESLERMRIKAIEISEAGLCDSSAYDRGCYDTASKILAASVDDYDPKAFAALLKHVMKKKSTKRAKA